MFRSNLVFAVFLVLGRPDVAMASPVVRAPVQVDGCLSEPAWREATVLRSFVFPWSDREPPRTEFRAFADSHHLFLAFEVADDDLVVEEGFPNESVVDREDRVEVFFSRDESLESYFCLEIDPLGRVHDYAARHYRRFDSSWNCPGLRTSATRQSAGYTVEMSLPLRTLSDLVGRPIAVGSTLRLGLFRAAFRPGALGESNDNWLSWVKPTVDKPDFHVRSAFADWRVPGLDHGDDKFHTRGVVLVAEDLSLTDWPERAAKAGLTTIALHHGTSPKLVADFMSSPAGRAFAADCSRLGLHIEYELHAMGELLPRELFQSEADLFRMGENGRRTPDANLCVHSTRALQIVATNAVHLAARLRPTTSRYFLWGDDGRPWCRCPECGDFSDSDQALLLENHLIRELRKVDPAAELAHLAYANTLPCPQRVRPERGVFLEFAPIERRYDVPFARQTGLSELENNLKVFPAATAQVLEYWLDVSRFSRWKRPAVKLPWRPDVLAADLQSYGDRGIHEVTTFAVWIDAAYRKSFGDPVAIQEYGDAFTRTASKARDEVDKTGEGSDRTAIRILNPPEKEFFGKYLNFHGIPIKAHEVVSDEALIAAYDRLSQLLGHQPAVISRLAAAGAELHIIGRRQVTTDLPEWRHDKGKPIAQYGGLTRDERTRGMGGLLSSCGEENLLKLDEDRYRGRDICIHEFSHCIRNHGMTPEIRERFNAQFRHSLEKGLWVESYAGSGPDEFFAELTMWYFGTHGDQGMTGPKPGNGLDGLRQYDPEAFQLFDDFYSGRG